MSYYAPLGGYPQFDRSKSGPVPWGAGGRSQVCFGEGVLPDLVRGLQELPALAAEGMPLKAAARPTVIGCVFRLTSSEVVDALLALDCCIVVDRQQKQREPLERLNRYGQPLSALGLPGFEELGLPGPDGGAPLIGPGSPIPGITELGPVRAAGWSPSRSSPPLVHVKMLLAGRAWVWEDDWGREQSHFTALRTWLGSANWTAAAKMHLEFGLWSDDPDLLAANQTFLLDVLRFSQPFDSATAGPAPELVDVDWDDDAFAEYVAEMGYPDGDDPQVDEK